MFETRLIGSGDYDQVAQIIEERFATFVEYDKIRHRISFDQTGFDNFKAKSLFMLKANARRLHLSENRPGYRMFGSFLDGQLMSFLAMHVISNHEWVLDNLKAREVKLSQTGLKETLRFSYKTVKGMNLDTYYCQIAAYRSEKFTKFFTKLVPEYHSEYRSETVRIIPAYSMVSPDFPEGAMGNRLPLVDLMVKRMSLTGGSDEIEVR